MEKCRLYFELDHIDSSLYGGDGGESSHVHIERDEAEAKFWLDPVRMERGRGFASKELNRIRELVEEHREQLLESWNDFFHG